MLVDNDQDCVGTIKKWVKDGCSINFFDVCKGVKKLMNGKLQDFSIRFNSHSIVLNSNLCHFMPTSDHCSLL